MSTVVEQVSSAARLSSRKRVTVGDVRALARRILTHAGPISKDDARRGELASLDQHATFSPLALREFQQLLARATVATQRPIEIPVDDQPYWLRGQQPLAGWQASAELPASADVVVIGAGLTGASAAYHLVPAVRKGQRVVVLERGDPAGEASGRNGGNFELIPENSLGAYEGLASERRAFLRRCYPALSPEVLTLESERQASLVLGFALRNRDLLKQIVLRERIECDFAPRGWLHVACNEEEEQGLCEEVLLAAQHGQRIELWPRRRIRDELGIDAQFLGRFVPGDGTFHPFKFTCGLLRRAIDAGVELYTRRRVLEIASDSENAHRVITDRGVIVARRLIVATNAFISDLCPTLHRIEARQSQIQLTEAAPDRARGRVVTCEDGPVFFNQPRGDARRGLAPLLMGGGPDRRMHSPSSRRRSPKVHATLLELRDRFYPELRGIPPSAEWVGPMAFTPDELPAIGVLRPGLIVAAGFNGYGGSYTTAAGLAAAEIALNDTPPSWLPADVFSPRRLEHDEPIFMSETEGLWRIASSLCVQLKAVNRQISDALAMRPSGRVASAVRGQTPPRVSRMLSAAELPAPEPMHVDPFELAPLHAFERFSPTELASLAESMVRLELAAGTRLFSEGEPGDTCYVVIRGTVDVSVKVRGEPQLLAQLGSGSIFGQVSLIGGEPRTASCSIRGDALLGELDRTSSERLLSGNSPMAIKLLGALTDGLVDALRNADRQLLRLDSRAPAAVAQ